MKATKQELINAIDFDKEWHELTDDEKANFLGLNGIGFLNKDNEAKVKRMYGISRMIVEERGKDKLYLYC